MLRGALVGALGAGAPSGRGLRFRRRLRLALSLTEPGTAGAWPGWRGGRKAAEPGSGADRGAGAGVTDVGIVG